MFPCFFATDLHGQISRYEKLFALIAVERPEAVFLGGDLLPRASFCLTEMQEEEFISKYLASSFDRLRQELGSSYPAVFVIEGNDDPKVFEAALLEAETGGVWCYLHQRKSSLGKFRLFGYACVPPTPFSLKDWERYDVSRYVDPGCTSPEEGRRSIPVDPSEVKWGTIESDLEALVSDEVLDSAISLMHTPPYDTLLDRAALDGKQHEHVPLDVHIGSIAVRRFIEKRQPLVTLHGHVHESARITGEWKIKMGRTTFNAAHDGPELALVRFDPACPDKASRELV